MSLSDYLENLVVNAFRGGGNGTNITAPAATYLKAHTGDPGEAGTSNAATETTRKEVQLGASSGGVGSLSNAPSWTNVAASETWTHFSEWDHVSAGNCLGSGALTTPVVLTAGDTVNVSAFTLTIT